LHRLKEYSVFNRVDGNVKAGNLVDIIVDYQNGDYDIVVSKIRVESISSKNNDDLKNKEYVIVMAVNEVQFRDLFLAEKIGVLKTRLYIDDDQKASDVTFNHIVAMEKLLIEKENSVKTTTNTREAESQDEISQASDEE